MLKVEFRFMKIVSDSSGHERQICQCEVDVEAQNPEEARALAEEKFCASEGVKNWQMHADTVEMDQVAREELADGLARKVVEELHQNDLTEQDLDAAVERIKRH